MLIRLYEEEVLAHDLYVELGKKHPDIMPFQNIPHAEQRHTEIMASVLEDRGISIPKPDKGSRFVSKGLDATYKKWLKEGRKSEQGACRVGVRLEDHDIADLQEATVKLPELKDTFDHLIFCSENHLRAFHRNLVARGGEYEVEALTKDEYKTILASEGSGCGGGGGCGKGCGKGQGQGKGKGQRNGQGNGKGAGQGRGKGGGGGGKCACEKG